ncbi:hypothetical protein EWB00_000440 [Schistosoma japonicum]|uniref:Uncharacterized protein n=1 Tax=Schistosoma japonicum TaxID=6182 RepID=A0A4Z2CKG4_SCHJA|nr:hypothetical protein EWB00_000440 [Schistosoma japonicum]
MAGGSVRSGRDEHALASLRSRSKKSILFEWSEAKIHLDSLTGASPASEFVTGRHLRDCSSLSYAATLEKKGKRQAGRL